MRRYHRLGVLPLCSVGQYECRADGGVDVIEQGAGNVALQLRWGISFCREEGRGNVCLRLRLGISSFGGEGRTRLVLLLPQRRDFGSKTFQLLPRILRQLRRN